MEEAATIKCSVERVGLEQVEACSAQFYGKHTGEVICSSIFKQQPFYLLEAKIAPNTWLDIQEVYTQEELPSCYIRNGNRLRMPNRS